MDFTLEDIALNRKLVAHHVEEHPLQHEQAGWCWNPEARMDSAPSLGMSMYKWTIGQYANHCQTNACIAGWTALLTLPHDLKLSEISEFTEADGFSGYAQKALGLSPARAATLFFHSSNERARDMIRELADNPEMR